MAVRSISVKRLRSLLLKLGFTEDRRRHHIFFYLRYQGRIVVRTKISHGAREISQPLLGLIGRQLRLGPKEFQRLLRGKLDRQAYLELLRKQGLI